MTKDIKAGEKFKQFADQRQPLLDQITASPAWQTLVEQMSADLSAERDDWHRRYPGIAYPETLHDWTALAVRAGLDPERYLHGEYTGSMVWAVVNGYLQRLADRGGAMPGDASDPKFRNPQWFQDEYGITSDTLRGAFRRAGGRIRREGTGKRTQYSAVDLARERPDLVSPASLA